MAGEFQFEMVFTADTSAVKPATDSVKNDLAGVGNAADQTTQTLNKHSDALERDAAAAKKAADASRLQAQAEREARDALARSVLSVPATDTASAPSAQSGAVSAIYGQSAEELKSELAGVSSIVAQATAEFDRHTASLQRATTATQHQVQADKELSAALGQQARTPSPSPASPSPLPQSTPNPLRQPSAPAPQPTPAPSSPGSSPEDLDKLKLAYLPLYSAQRNYEKALSDIDALQKANAISSDDHAVALAKAQRTFDNETTSAKRAASALLGHKDAVKLTAFETKNLAFQANDTVQSLALGMPAMQVFMQQGPQAVQAVGGVGNALRLVGQAATVTNLTLAGSVAAIAIAAAAWNSYLNSIKPVQIAASGLGRAVAGTATDMERSAQAGASAANISVKSARSMEAQFLSTGRIGSENFEKLIGVSKNFATTIGVSSDEAGTVLAQLFADPAKAAQVLYHQYGLIDGATADYATRLANQNRLSEAQTVILNALPDRLAKAREATTLLGRAWDGVANAAANAYDRMGKAVDRQFTAPSLAEQTEDARQRLDAAKRTRDKASGGFISTITGYNPAQSELDRDQADYDRLRKQLDEQEKKDTAARKKAAEERAAANAISIAQQSPANADLLQRQALEDSIAALNSGGKQPTPELQNQVNEAIKAKTTLLANLTDKQVQLNAIDQLDIQIQNARDPLTRADLTYRQQILVLGQQEGNQAAAEATALRLRNDVIQSSIAAASAQAANMQDELAIRKKLDAQVVAGTLTADQAQAKMQEELQLRPLIAAADKAEGETKRQLLDVINQLRGAYGDLATQQQRMAAISIATQSPANASREQEKALRQQIKQLQDGIALGGNDPQISGEQNAALKEKQRLVDALVNKQQILNEIDALGVRIQNENNPAIQAELKAIQMRLQLSLQEGDAIGREGDIRRAYNDIIDSTIAGAAKQASDMSVEIGIRQKLNAQVAAGTITSDDAQRKLQEELQLRPLIAAAATLEGEKKKELLAVIANLRAGYEGLAASERDASTTDFLRGQDEQIEKLKLQQSLIGQNSTVQAKANALLEAEQEIRRRGYDATSKQAEAIRASYTEQVRLNTEIKKQSDAWGEVQKTSEGVIDSLVGGATSGKMGDALKDSADSIKKTFEELFITNPLKNGLLGTDYATGADVGGIGGIFTRLLGGGNSKDPKSLVTSAMAGKSVASMMVTAGTVVINGGIGGLPAGTSQDTTGSIARLLNPANSNAPGGNISTFAQAIKNIESSGNYSALGPITKSGDRAYGAYGVMGSNIPDWTKGALGYSMSPSQFLSNKDAQDAVFSKYFGASVAKYGNPQDAASVWFTGRPQATGANASDILGTTGSGYVAKFNAQLTSLGTSATAASANVGGLGSATGTAAQGLMNFGGGIGQFGSQLMSTFTGGGGSSGGGLFGSLFSSIGKLFGGGSSSGFDIGSNAVPYNKFDVGGWTGAGGKYEPAGVVHKGEFVFDAESTASAGVSNLDRLHRTLKGYADGGAVGRSVFSAPGLGHQPAAANDSQRRSDGGLNVIVNNNGTPARVEAVEETDERGRRQLRLEMSDQVGSAISAKGGGARKTIEKQYGLKSAGIKR